MASWRDRRIQPLVDAEEDGLGRIEPSPSLLADACAGESKGKITDRSDAYEFMGKMVAAERADPPPKIDSGALGSAQAGLVSLAVNTVKTDGIPLENILALILLCHEIWRIYFATAAGALA